MKYEVTDEAVKKADMVYKGFDGGCADSMKAAIEAALEVMAQPTPAQDNDGWIVRDARSNHNPAGDKLVDIKTMHGQVILGIPSIILIWSSIFAYRIIDEPISALNQLYYTKRMIKEKCDEYVKEKEPKKQTLLQWLAYQNCGKPSVLTEREQFLFGLISKYGQYLEQNK